MGRPPTARGRAPHLAAPLPLEQQQAEGGPGASFLTADQRVLLGRLRNVKVVRLQTPQGGWAASHEAALGCRAPTSQVRSTMGRGARLYA